MTLRQRLAGVCMLVGAACTGSDPQSDPSGGTTGTSSDGSASEAGSEGSTGEGGTTGADTSTGAAESDGSSDDGGDGTSSGGTTGEPESGGLPASVFGGGPFYHQAAEVMPRIKASGFDTAIIWTIHVSETGDFVLNDAPIFSDGEYVGDPGWPEQVASLKDAPTTVTRIELGVGSYGVPDFEHIQALIAAEGTGTDSILWRNFEALAATLPDVDAINYDDESNYDVASAVALTLMLADLDFHVTLTPYTAQSFWTGLFDEVEGTAPGTIDRVMLQVYAGGAGNDPAAWSSLFGSVDIEAGLWSLHGPSCSVGDTPEEVAAKLGAWSSSIRGGWIWLLDDLLACDDAAPLEDYAAAIDGAFE